MNKISILILSLSIGLLSACGSKSTLDWKKEDVHLNSFDFYQTIDSFRKSYEPSYLNNFQTNHPYFIEIYFNELLPWKSTGDFSQQIDEFKEFLQYKDYSNLLDTVLTNFPNTKKIDESIAKTLKHIKATKGNFLIPEEVYYFITGLNYYYAIILDDNKIGVGLDMFLGADYPHYAHIEFPIPPFLLLRMEQKHIPLWIAQNIYLDQYPLNVEGEDLLSLMIQKGKEYFFLEQVLPDIPMNEIFGFTPAQFQWAEEQERNIYNFFLQNELLYSKDPSKIMRYISETFTTTGLDAQSPGNLGSFIGWKIVSNFANLGNSVSQTLEADAGVQFLKKSKYKP